MRQIAPETTGSCRRRHYMPTAPALENTFGCHPVQPPCWRQSSDDDAPDFPGSGSVLRGNGAPVKAVSLLSAGGRCEPTT